MSTSSSSISKNDKINGYRLAKLPLYAASKGTPFVNDQVRVTPPAQNNGVITTSQRYNFNVDVFSASKTEEFRWVIAYGDPYLYPSYFTEESILAYGETSNFSFTFEEGERDIFIRVDIFDGSVPSDDSFNNTRLSRILKLRTTSNGESEKFGYLVIFSMILFVAFILLAVLINEQISRKKSVFRIPFS